MLLCDFKPLVRESFEDSQKALSAFASPKGGGFYILHKVYVNVRLLNYKYLCWGHLKKKMMYYTEFDTLI